MAAHQRKRATIQRHVGDSSNEVSQVSKCSRRMFGTRAKLRRTALNETFNLKVTSCQFITRISVNPELLVTFKLGSQIKHREKLGPLWVKITIDSGI